MKRILMTLATVCLVLPAIATPVQKIIDEGGSGPYKAVALSEQSLPDFVVYRPQNIPAAVAQGGALPLMVFANGGCNDTSLPHEKMLNDLASYGYIVIALGQMQERIDDRPLGKSPNEDMLRAIEWVIGQNGKKESPYFASIDTAHIALGGQSCGGAQVLANCGDPRIKTCILYNSGMGDMEMAGTSRESLKKLHGPILYIIGGKGDIAYRNAEADYERIEHVPVAFANQLRVGHGGTFHETFGGSFSRLTRLWLDAHFKQQKQNMEVFLHNRLEGLPDYTMKAKNFPETNEPFTTREIHCKSRDGKDIWGMAYIPNTAEKRKPTVVMAHGYNGNHAEPQDYAECLAMHGIASYIFDFCGGSNHSRSEGSTTEMTIFTEKENIEDITRTVRTWDFVDSTRMALLGCSQGGLVAALTAAAHPRLFRALVLVYPALLIPETAPAMLARFEQNNNQPLEVMGMKLGRIYYEKINGLPVLDIIGRYKGKTFVVYGDKDGIIAGNTLTQARKKYVQLEEKIISGGNHGFSNYLHHAQATEGIVGFILRTLR